MNRVGAVVCFLMLKPRNSVDVVALPRAYEIGVKMPPFATEVEHFGKERVYCDSDFDCDKDYG